MINVIISQSHDESKINDQCHMVRVINTCYVISWFGHTDEVYN